MEKTISKTRAKRRFLLLYLVSLVLIFIVVSAFWKTSSSAPVESVVQSNDDASIFMQIDTFLHAKIEALDAKISRYAEIKRPEDLTAIQRSIYFIQSAIDSVDKQAAILLEGSRKQHMQLAISNFNQLLGERNRILYGGGPAPVQNTAAGSGNVSGGGGNASQTEELNQLRAQLTQKDKRIQDLEQLNSASGQDKDKLIVSLQNQLRQKEAALQQRPATSTQSTGGADSEWRQKYASLKSTFDKTAASEKALKAAYKAVADDNRRLLNQLQTIRAEKKN